MEKEIVGEVGYKMKLFTYLKLQNLFIIIFMLGVIFNSVAVLRNDCKMPVFLSYDYEGKYHDGFNDKQDVNYYYLTDIFRIRNIHFSVGDIFISIGGIGLCRMLLYQAKQCRRIKKGGKWEDF